MRFSAATIRSGLENPLSTRVVWACGAITAEKTPNARECFVHSGTCDERNCRKRPAWSPPVIEVIQTVQTGPCGGRLNCGRLRQQASARD